MPDSRTAGWYEIPHYYDIVFDEDTELEVGFLEAMLEIHGGAARKPPPSARVLEPACGSGRLVAALAERGHRVSGFDVSAAMLDYARRRLADRGVRADLWLDRMESFQAEGRFDLAHCLVSTFKYLLDEESARAHLLRVAELLRPGGLYVLGVHLTEYELTRRLRERWVASRGGTRVVCNIQTWPADRRRRIERVRSRLHIEEHGDTRHLETEWDFRTYDAAQLARLLRSVPALEHVATYDFSYELSSRRELDDEQMDCVLVLRRR